MIKVATISKPPQDDQAGHLAEKTERSDKAVQWADEFAKNGEYGRPSVARSWKEELTQTVELRRSPDPIFGKTRKVGGSGDNYDPHF